jgi:hypothetical protein
VRSRPPARTSKIDEQCSEQGLNVTLSGVTKKNKGD